MTQYLIRRLIFGVILIFLASMVSFTLLRMSPGQPGAADWDPRVSREYIEQQKRMFGLDKHPARQYLIWLGGLFRGDMGLSLTYKQPVTRVISDRLAATLVLNIT